MSRSYSWSVSEPDFCVIVVSGAAEISNACVGRACENIPPVIAIEAIIAIKTLEHVFFINFSPQMVCYANSKKEVPGMKQVVISEAHLRIAIYL